jgi:hypothetical protein
MNRLWAWFLRVTGPTVCTCDEDGSYEEATIDPTTLCQVHGLTGLTHNKDAR